jgi:hypothetical protein
MSNVAYLYADYAAMVAALGEPNPEDISDPDKIDAEWNVVLDGCIIVNVYSYHDVQPEHRHVPVTQPGVIAEWHVQAPSPAALKALSRMVFGENGYTITHAGRWPGDTTGRYEMRKAGAPDHTGDVPDDIAYRFTIIDRSAFDDFTEPVACAGCGDQCGGDTQKAPINYAVMHVGNGEEEPMCEACTRTMAAGPIWDLAVALDNLNFEFLKAADGWLDRLLDLAAYHVTEDIDTWRRLRRGALIT